jgi:hypothetical protein
LPRIFGNPETVPETDSPPFVKSRAPFQAAAD